MGHSQVEKAKSRERILDAAARRIREGGFDGLSIAELMKSANLTHGGFYGHFPSRAALLAEALERAMDRGEASPVAAAPPSERPADPTALALGLAPTEELPAVDPEDLADPTATSRPSLPMPTSLTETASSADGPWPSRAPASGAGVGRAWDRARRGGRVRG